jgi:hypothetical protein
MGGNFLFTGDIMRFIELYDFIKKFCNDDVISTEEAHRLVDKFDKDSSGTITYREVIIELSDRASSMQKSSDGAGVRIALGGILALLVASVCFFVYKCVG